MLQMHSFHVGATVNHTITQPTVTHCTFTVFFSLVVLWWFQKTTTFVSLIRRPHTGVNCCTTPADIHNNRIRPADGSERGIWTQPDLFNEIQRTHYYFIHIFLQLERKSKPKMWVFSLITLLHRWECNYCCWVIVSIQSDVNEQHCDYHREARFITTHPGLVFFKLGFDALCCGAVVLGGNVPTGRWRVRLFALCSDLPGQDVWS